MQKRANIQKTIIPTKKQCKLNWFILDATGKTLGRLTSEIAKILRGKHKPLFTTNFDCGDGVIVVNADKIVVSGAKESQKIYRYYTGSIAGLREIPYRTMKARKPEYIIEHAVKGMMPKSRLGRQQVKKLRIYAGPAQDHLVENGHAAQQPVHVNI